MMGHWLHIARRAADCPDQHTDGWLCRLGVLGQNDEILFSVPNGSTTLMRSSLPAAGGNGCCIGAVALTP